LRGEFPIAIPFDGYLTLIVSKRAAVWFVG
jgi:hypothetical protein